MRDVIIIGAGVVGCAIAYELSRYQADILVLEKEEDVCSGTSKANSGIAHGGYDAVPGSAKAAYNILGLQLMEEKSKKLDFAYDKIGSLVLCQDKEQLPELEALYQQGLQNGASGMQILSREEVLAMEPNVADTVEGALYCAEAGIINPFTMTIAYAEQANVNGVTFQFDQTVQAIEREDDHWKVVTSDQTYTAKIIVNAAGVHSDELNNQVNRQQYKIRPRKGEYLLLDNETKGLVSHVLFTLPTAAGKGVLVTPTTDGNILLGPTSEFIGNKDEVETSTVGLAAVRTLSAKMVPSIPFNKVITSFTGLRAHEEEGDFVIGESEDREGFYNCIGIESPGLTAAPAIGVEIAGQIQAKMAFPANPNFIEERQGIRHTAFMTREEHQAMIEENADYGRIICRCEQVTEGEILDAIHRPIGAKSLDGLKRRTRATAGRCQGGFCTPYLIEILARELGVDPLSITKKNKKSPLLSGQTREEA